MMQEQLPVLLLIVETDTLRINSTIKKQHDQQCYLNNDIEY
jgi:hypothetical protein